VINLSATVVGEVSYLGEFSRDFNLVTFNQGTMQI